MTDGNRQRYFANKILSAIHDAETNGCEVVTAMGQIVVYSLDKQESVAVTFKYPSNPDDDYWSLEDLGSYGFRLSEGTI